ncbi:MAG: hypothetical protein WC753_04620 [Candidatus Gracilibacteria bacterium]|jgi:hypothetical protein
MNRPHFTQEQKDWICYQIGEWYLIVKDNLVNYQNKTHRLGQAKELLKGMVCDDLKDYFLSLIEGLEENE